jgi:uncharacterized membrane protein YwzB
MAKKTKKRLSKKKVSNIMLTLICIMIFAYTVASFVLQYHTGVEVSATLTTAWFAFWGTELLSLMVIKTGKMKYGYDKPAEEDTEAAG